MSGEAAQPETTRKVGFGLGVGILLIPLVFIWFLLRKGHSERSRIIGFAWLGFTIAFTLMRSILSPSTPNNAASTAVYGQPAQVSTFAPPAPPQVLRITAIELNRAYKKNEVSADDQFKGRTIQVSGRVSSITKDAFDNMHVRLAVSEFGLDDVDCKMPDSLKSEVGSLSKGQSIEVQGKVTGMVIGIVSVDVEALYR